VTCFSFQRMEDVEVESEESLEALHFGIDVIFLNFSSVDIFRLNIICKTVLLKSKMQGIEL